MREKISRRALLGAIALGGTLTGAAARAADRQKAAGRRKALPVLERLPRGHFAFAGLMGARIEANLRHWLLVAPVSNPAMLQMFRDRDRTPSRNLVPWAGEFAGKYLISAVQSLRLTSARPLRAALQAFVAELIATQRTDGYLGPFPASEGMMGPGRWDLWGQYHVMLGLYLWYEATGDKAAHAACCRCADLFCRTFLEGGKRVVQAGSEEMNESSIHIFPLLYQDTGEPRYLQMAREIEKDWETAPSGDYVRASLAGKPFFQMPRPRWESLHSVQAIAELYYITGDTKYRQAFTQIWSSILVGDRHNTGGFSSGEQATGNPYDPRPIETCCTIAWMALTLDYLRLTGESRAADELELSTWNAVLGAQNESGRWWTYNTPMDGERKAATQDIVFQARAGSSELNCCSVNGPRGLGMLGDWAVMQAQDGLALNYYGPSSFSVGLPSGRKARLVQQTAYPRDGHIHLTVTLETPERFTLQVRIPGWSRQASVTVNGQSQANVHPGAYLPLDRIWQSGDLVEIVLEMSPWFWVGEREAHGKTSVYHGPLLLAYDPRFDRYDPARLPTIEVAHPPKIGDGKASLAAPGTGEQMPLTATFATTDGSTITLCDFAHAGASGNLYVSWLPLTDAPTRL
jgi:DUF1680 family protein